MVFSFMKKVKYRNNNNYSNQVYSINYKFDSVSPAGKVCGTALDLIKKYNELAKEAQANGNHVEAEVFRQYAEHYRKIITEINERKNIRFNNKETPVNAENNAEISEDNNNSSDNNTKQVEESEQLSDNNDNKKEGTLVETKPKSVKKAFKVIEVSNDAPSTKRTTRAKGKKNETIAANE